MNEVVVQEQRLANARLQVLGVMVAVDLKGAAWFDAGQHAHQALADAILGSDAARDVLLADFGRCQYWIGRPVVTASASDAAFNSRLTCSTCAPNDLSSISLRDK